MSALHNNNNNNNNNNNDINNNNWLMVIGALGLIKKGLEKYTKQIPGNIKISELQKIAQLGTSRILRKTLSIK